MFSEILKGYDWETTTRQIQNKNEADVRRALAKEKLSIDDFMALVSPAAAPFLEEMAVKSQRVTRRRFGKTISM
ncbi:MAG: 2-iminoacetate synthase ThiH, partial [Muribaculaceae bacterium]|nr:2-iminoacetate synthase ThiH [Muribaculaceae bacterium]